MKDRNFIFSLLLGVAVIVVGITVLGFNLTTYARVAGTVKINSINPAAGAIGTTVTLSGSGFTSSNMLHFGGGIIPNVASSRGGKSITFVVPNSMNPACYYNNPPCSLQEITVQPGSYAVYVSNTKGNSNLVTFTVN